MRELRWAWLGRAPYLGVWGLQETLRRAVVEGESEVLLLLEHDPVFTLGRNATQDDVTASAEWLDARGIDVVETNRGGQVTYHGPGQLVAYPILNLSPDRRDVRRYVDDLLGVVVATLADLGIEAGLREGKEHIGVWVDDAKIASLGVHLSRWVTNHGIALNVAPRLEHFGGIVACGLRGVTMTSVEAVLGAAPELPEIARTFADRCAATFGRRLVEVPAGPLRVRFDPAGAPVGRRRGR